MSKKTLCLVSLLVLAGCSSSSGGATGGGASTPTDFQASLDAATCSWNVKCGYIGASEQKACEDGLAAATKDFPQGYDNAEAATAKRLSYDAAAGAKCLEIAAKLGCTLDEQFALSAQCAGVYVGAVPVGGSCKSDLECVGGWCDMGPDVSTDGCPGTCTAFVATGATCDPNAPHCAPTDSCNSTSKKCTARAAAGAKCGGADPSCQSGLFCKGYVAASGSTPATPGTCAAPGNLGDPCTTYFFGNTNCTPGLFCDDMAATPTCKTRLTAGTECDSFSSCADGLACIGLAYDPDTYELTAKGKCTGYLDVNKTCAAADETGCPYDTSCDATALKCLPYGNLGADCSDAGTGGSCGDRLYCDGVTSKCTKMVGFGSACTPATGNGDDPCEDGSCDATSKTCVLVCK